MPEKVRLDLIMNDNDSNIGEILAFQQDSFGFMWIGGRNGLARYDGYDYKIYHHDAEVPHSISANTVYDITVNQQGELWLATEGGLNRYDYRTEQFIRYEHNPTDINTVAHNSIFRLHVDSQNQLWLGTQQGLNRYIPETDTILRYPRNPAESDLYTQYMLDITDDGNGTYYLATGYGLKVWHSHTGEIETLKPHQGASQSNVCRTILYDDKGRIWVGTDAGLLQYLPETRRFQFIRNEIDPPDAQFSPPVWDVHQDAAGVVWVAYDGQGVAYFDETSGQLKSLYANEKDPYALSSNIIRRIYDDKAGDVWIGAFPSGVNIFSRLTADFTIHTDSTDDDRSISYQQIRTFHEDDNGDLWIGTDGGGINIRDAETGRYRVMTTDPDGGKSRLGANEVLTIMQDDQGRYWIGSWSAGVTVYDPKNDTTRHYTKDDEGEHALAVNHVWDIFQASNGDIWVATISGGVSRYEPELDGFITYHHHRNRVDSIGDERSWVIEEDSWGDLWFGTQTGLSRYHYETDSFTTYTTDVNNPDSIAANRILAVVEDSQKRLWVGTQGGGLNLYHRERDAFTAIRQQDGFLSDVVVAIVEDNNGMIWISSDKGISSYDPDTQVINNYTSAHGVQPGEFAIGAALKSRNGDLLFGGIEGYTRFNPEHIQPDHYIPQMVFTTLSIIDEPVTQASEDSPLDISFLLADHLTFNYEQNIFSFNYAGISFRNTNNIVYDYQLEGFDSDWRHAGHERKATYTNLDGGNYVFKVRALTDTGIKSDIISKRITVLPPPWKTWWAYCGYAGVILLLVSWYMHTQRKIIENERRVVSELKKVDRLKDEFLANTSHELRTPLFGMMGLAEAILDSDSGRLSNMDTDNLSMIIASGKRLSAIIDDVLDFSKIRNNSLTLRRKPTDINAASVMVVALSRTLITNRNLTIENNISTTLPSVYADEDRVQQIFHNLIGNAIKFTESGTITLSAKEHNGTLVVSIQDTGVGIPEDQFEALFESFKQLEASETRAHEGTGLGLAITKNLVHLHGGEIWLSSIVGKGTTFYFSLPVYTGEEQPSNIALSDKIVKRIQAVSDTPDNKAHPQILNPSKDEDKKAVSDTLASHSNASYAEESQVISTTDSTTYSATISTTTSTTTATPISTHVKHSKILVVDDEPVNRRVLRNHLTTHQFNVVEAESGTQALALFEQGEHFDLVLLDVMMPHLSGYDVCRRIREEHGRHSLPIVFLTAKYQLHDIITGFECGGNDFLSKPISRPELLVRVDLHLQLLESSRNLEAKIEERTHELKKAYKQLEQVSLSDPLTGLANRRFFEKFIEADAAETLRKYQDWLAESTHSKNTPPPKEEDLIFMLVDIDHFKSVNDNYGHAAGDAVLIKMAEILRECCRQSDYVVRWGGEEFMILGRFLSRDSANTFAKRIRKTVENTSFDIGEHHIHITCSIGYAAFPLCYQHPEHYRWEDTMRIADLALYAAKNSGRNAWIGALAMKNNRYDVSEFAEAIANKDINIVTSIADKKTISW
ncbi:two-component regulator propeller domain-containing protein [Marinibactrum halimedae]|uniref:histidine kinase n=1 Tax=Marinibactrum halimedae TaxID=1444977 RepID=A0AA37TBX9_9GAMM|nr:two-component regulator propeller domain-containing protein [Marinibactrum halimedae]MCD9460797.1 diguanylate cyclase [Marinibactrum halimedae]GLS27386.1 hybrid sensor histidine kinase/response regulator [Marinibactrum halimedae]